MTSSVADVALLRAVLEQNPQARELSERTREGGGTYEDRLALGQLVAQEVQGRALGVSQLGLARHPFAGA